MRNCLPLLPGLLIVLLLAPSCVVSPATGERQLVLISSDPPLMLFSLFVVYGLSGHVLLLWRWSRGRQQGRAAAPGTTVQATPAREAPDRRDEPPSGGQSV